MPPMQRTTLCVLGLWLATAALAQSGEEVPFITTPDHVTLAMLQLAGVTRQDFVLDLGSGDGRIVITAARRFGARGHGVEIVPELVERSRANAQNARVAKRTSFAVQDLFATDLRRATVITMYLLPEVNLRLRPRLLALKPGTRIVSHDWDLGDWLPDATLTIEVPDKAVGREKISRLHRWVVPAQVQGLWCSHRGAALQLAQHYQVVEASVQDADGSSRFQGRLNGATLTLQRDGVDWIAQLQGQGQTQTMQFTPSPGGRAGPARWWRSKSASCPAQPPAR
jgi:SAM-dependent methyltransferase